MRLTLAFCLIASLPYSRCWLIVGGLISTLIVSHDALLSFAAVLRLPHAGLAAVLTTHILLAFEVVFLGHR